MLGNRGKVFWYSSIFRLIQRPNPASCSLVLTPSCWGFPFSLRCGASRDFTSPSFERKNLFFREDLLLCYILPCWCCCFSMLLHADGVTNTFSWNAWKTKEAGEKKDRNSSIFRDFFLVSLVAAVASSVINDARSAHSRRAIAVFDGLFARKEASRIPQKQWTRRGRFIVSHQFTLLTINFGSRHACPTSGISLARVTTNEQNPWTLKNLQLAIILAYERGAPRTHE